MKVVVRVQARWVYWNLDEKRIEGAIYSNGVTGTKSKDKSIKMGVYMRKKKWSTL